MRRIGEVAAATGGIHDSLSRMYETEGPEKASRGTVSGELFAWMAEAVRARS
jgi:hypothetical protein